MTFSLDTQATMNKMNNIEFLNAFGVDKAGNPPQTVGQRLKKFVAKHVSITPASGEQKEEVEEFHE